MQWKTRAELMIPGLVCRCADHPATVLPFESIRNTKQNLVVSGALPSSLTAHSLQIHIISSLLNMEIIDGKWTRSYSQ